MKQIRRDQPNTSLTYPELQPVSVPSNTRLMSSTQHLDISRKYRPLHPRPALTRCAVRAISRRRGNIFGMKRIILQQQGRDRERVSASISQSTVHTKHNNTEPHKKYIKKTQLRERYNLKSGNINAHKATSQSTTHYHTHTGQMGWDAAAAFICCKY